MDTRLLLVWSNCLIANRPTQSNIFIVLLGLLFLFSGLEKAWARGQEQPLSQVRFVWKPVDRKLVGVQYVALPQDQNKKLANRSQSTREARNRSSIDFWILPNRDLLEASQPRLTREQRELKAAAPTIEWPYADVGLGVLSLRGAFSATTDKPCPSTQEVLVAQVESLQWTRRDFEKHDSERHLRIDVVESPKMLCLFLQLKFEFEPRLGEGNFSLKNDGIGNFSGPIFPLLKEEPVSTRVVFQPGQSGFVMSCARCRKVNSQEIIVDFFGLSPALHFIPENSDSENFLHINDISLASQSLIPKNKGEEELLQSVQLFYKALHAAFLREKSNGNSSWQILLRRNALLDRLVIDQVEEIQLHSSFGNVSPLLASYHRAALFRVLSRDFVRTVLMKERLPNWESQGENEIVARVLAEMWLQSAFPKLNNLRELSDKFDFLPFFRAVQEGSAFLNNSVFVGAEEGVSELDFSIFHEFFAPLSGAELLMRLRDCALSDDFLGLQQLAADVALGQAGIREFRQRLKNLKPNAQCRTPLRSGLLPDFFSRESIQIFEDKSTLILERKVINSPPTFQFFLSRNGKLPRENLKIDVIDVKEGAKSFVFTASDFSEETISLPKSLEVVQVVPPHPSVNSDRLSWPRPLRTVLQALALNYDSRRTDLVLRSQLQTTQTGDEWGRAFSFGYRRESGHHIDLEFRTRLPSLVPKTTASFAIAGTSRIQSAPPTHVSTSYSVKTGTESVLYPEGMGLSLWLRRPLSLAALNEQMVDPEQEWIFNFNTGLAPRLTWAEIISYGSSEGEVDVGLRSVPAWPTSEYRSKEYALVRSELRHTLAQNLNATLAKSILFQHAVLYGAHVFAFDRLRTDSTDGFNARVAQSLLVGFRLYGALFGAKDQAVSCEIARALTDPARTSLGFTLGKGLN